MARRGVDQDPARAPLSARGRRAAMNALPASMRRAQILDRIRRDGGVTIAELARSHAISNMTAHRDLEQLAREGLVERVRGGARALPAGAGAARPPDRLGAPDRPGRRAPRRRSRPRRRRWSRAARRSSSTPRRPRWRSPRTLAAAPPFELTLVTNSPMIAGEIRADSIHVVVCPGELDQHTRTITGRWTVEFIRRLNFDVAFVSAAGITLDAGLTTSREPDRRRAPRRPRRPPGARSAWSTRRSSAAPRSSRSRRRAGARPADHRRRAAGGRRRGLPRGGRGADARAGLTPLSRGARTPTRRRSGRA